MPTVPLNNLQAAQAPGLTPPDETAQWMALATMHQLGRVQDPKDNVVPLRSQPPRRVKR